MSGADNQTRLVADSAKANLYEIQLNPPVQTLFRGERSSREASVGGEVLLGKYAYSLEETKTCRTRVSPDYAVLKELIHGRLRQAVEQHSAFFDISDYGIFGSIAGELLYKEDVFSVARSFDLQVLFTANKLYLAVLAGHRVYNRLRLPEVLGLLGANALAAPQRGLCFTGEKERECWRDCSILSISSDNVLVRVPSVSPPDISVPPQRVIPKLDSGKIKRIVHLKGSKTQLEIILKRIQSGKGDGEAKYYLEASESLRSTHLAKLFPIALGASQIQLNSNPCGLKDLAGC